MIIQEQGFPHENRRPEDNCCGGGIRSEESNDGGDLTLSLANITKLFFLLQGQHSFSCAAILDTTSIRLLSPASFHSI